MLIPELGGVQAVTVTGTAAVTEGLFASVPVIVAIPGPTAVTTAFESTFATFVFDELQMTLRPTGLVEYESENWTAHAPD
jgi:hypothetical protein